MRLEALVKAAADVLFPQHLKCHCCNRESVVNSYGVCADCESKLKSVPALPNLRDIDGFDAGLLYTEPARRALVSFKFNGAVYKKEFLAHFMAIPPEWSADCIVPVPLSENRLKQRGYNQSEVLAEAVSEKCALPVRTDLLARVMETEKQSLMTREQRLKNLKGAFLASKECRGLSIVLVDDIKTTGSTLSECAGELKKRGAVRVYALTACCAEEGNTNGYG